jgi:hypothetical protein
MRPRHTPVGAWSGGPYGRRLLAALVLICLREEEEKKKKWKTEPADD